MKSKIKESCNYFYLNKRDLKRKIDEKITNKQKKPIVWKPIVVSLIIILIGLLYYSYNTATSYISIDINPSIVLKANIYDKVIDVDLLNEDAQKLVDETTLKGKSISDASDIIIDKAVSKGYIKPEQDNALLFTVYCNNEGKKQKIEHNLNERAKSNLKQRGIKSLIIDQHLTEYDIELANKYNVSPGKILFIKKAIKENQELKIEELVNKPVREIAKYLKEYNNLEFGKNKMKLFN